MSNDDVTRGESAANQIQMPPTTLLATLSRIGPGLIIAGSIVGSGELIATTTVGAETGFGLLWLIVIGCVIKVFAQIEFGRHTVTHGQTPLEALDSVPGPRFKVNWILWYWAVMMCLIIVQQGGIVGGIGQALAISIPLTEKGRVYNEAADASVAAKVELSMAKQQKKPESEISAIQQRIDEMAGQRLEPALDVYYWASIVAVITSVLLYAGRYGFIQSFSTILVVGFTVFTLLTVALLQTKPDWAVTLADLKTGFDIPAFFRSDVKLRLATALSAFGIIGVGASELIMYPYWCLEKGYARFTGPRDQSDAWAVRARGWMRVMHTDVWASMIVYTFATLAFFVLGAAVLGRVGLVPASSEMVRTLSQMYVPVFGEFAPTVFLIGAFSVLYSTYFVAAAGNSRCVADGLGLFGLHDRDERTRMVWTKWISVAWPMIALLLFLGVKLVTGKDSPARMVLLSGMAQAIMLPMLGIAALYFRYVHIDRRLKPSILWDAMLLLSFVGLTIAGVYAAYTNIEKLLFPS